MTRTLLLLPAILLLACDETTDSGEGIDPTATEEGVHAATCAGTQLGTYSGDDAGLVTGDLAADGTLTITFGSSFGDVNAQGFVAADGSVSGTQEGVTITGTYDLGGCSGAGDWVNTPLSASGTWQIEQG